ncbi:MAG: hypothetical protein LBB43_06760 [Spirochaetaceae bacterium]|nr:hypothetical protein [Spirochaetaceae bacterium]
MFHSQTVAQAQFARPSCPQDFWSWLTKIKNGNSVNYTKIITAQKIYLNIHIRKVLTME